MTCFIKIIITFAIIQHPQIHDCAALYIILKYQKYKSMKKSFTYFMSSLTALIVTVGMYAQMSDTDSGAKDDKTVYKETFDTQEAFDTFIIINANNDKVTWRYNKNEKHAECYYASKETNDDWLITPEISLKAGKVYQVSFDTWASGSYYTEKLSVWYGQGKEPSKYDVLLPTLAIKYGVASLSNTVTIKANGNYRIAFHAESPANQYALNLDNIVVKEIASAAAPAAVTFMTATPGDKGELKATVSFTSPEKAIDGNAISSLTKIDVLRDNKVIHTFENPAVNQSMSYTDEQAPNGNHTYSVVAYNEAGAGLPVSSEIYIGQDIPGAVSNVKLVDNGSTYTLSWTAPNKGATGRYFSGTNLKYNIYIPQGGYSAKLFKANVDGTSITIPCIGGEQDLMRYQVSAINIGGESEKTNSNVIVVGDVYDLPIAESFDDGKTNTKHYWWRDSKSQNYWRLSSNGYILWTPDNEYDEAWWNSGKISLSNSAKPKLTFKYNILAKSRTAIQVEAQKPNLETVKLGYVDGFTSGKNGWQSYRIDLSPVKDERYVIIKFHGVADDTEYIGLDDINIADDTENNLAVKVSAPALGTTGLPLQVQVIVNNTGSKAASNFTIHLYQNGEAVADSTVTEPIASLESHSYPLSFVPLVGTESAEIYAVIDYAADEYLENNTSKKVIVPLQQPTMKPATNLTVSKTSENSTTISWTAPTHSQTVVTDDFESYKPFYLLKEGPYLLANYQIGPWTLFDGDQEYSIALPGYNFENMEECFAYMVFNPSKVTTLDKKNTDLDKLETFQAHSGSQFLTSFSINDDMAMYSKKSNDWLISPLLTGDKQTIKFWANALMSGSNGEAKYEVLYSKTDTLAESFIVVQPEKSAPANNWTENKVELPDGAKYFAIHCTTPITSLQIFMLDDITYTTGDGEIKGYNVYRDGKKIARVDANTTSFNDEATGNHQYQVTVVYNSGESVYSNSVTTGIERMTNEKDLQEKAVYNLNGQKLPAKQRGVNIIKMSDGSTRKVVIP